MGIPVSASVETVRFSGAPECANSANFLAFTFQRYLVLFI